MAVLENHLSRDKGQGLTVRPEPFGYAQESLVEGWAVKPFMVRQAHHERLNLITTNGLTLTCPRG